MGGCHYGLFLGPYYSTAPNIQGTPKRDHNFDNHPYRGTYLGLRSWGSESRHGLIRVYKGIREG